jgi:tetratricopeptide (TPR) repeat protein
MSQESQAISQGISLLLTQGRTAEARAELERLLALDPDDPEARSQAGDVYAYTGAHSTAYKQYNQAAETYNRMGRADMALAVHHKILELDSTMMEPATQTRLRLLALLVTAEDAIVMGQYDKAVAGFHEAIRHFPNHTITYQRLASLLVRLNRVEEAAEQYLVVARAFYAHGVLAKARPYFERVLELKPAQSEGLESLLACLKFEHKEDEGARFIKAAVQAHLQAGRSDEARDLFDRLPAAGQEEVSPLGAAVLLQGGDVGQAERMAAQLDLQRIDVQAFFRGLGRAALERGDSVSADTYFRWAQGQASLETLGAAVSAAATVPSSAAPPQGTWTAPPAAVPAPPPVLAAPPAGMPAPLPMQAAPPAAAPAPPPVLATPPAAVPAPLPMQAAPPATVPAPPPVPATPPAAVPAPPPFLAAPPATVPAPPPVLATPPAAVPAPPPILATPPAAVPAPPPILAAPPATVSAPPPVLTAPPAAVPSRPAPLVPSAAAPPQGTWTAPPAAVPAPPPILAAPPVVVPPRVIPQQQAVPAAALERNEGDGPAVRMSIPPQGPVVPEDRAVLQTMGEMCLAEEMFEEAKQVFERLSQADPEFAVYWDLLNRARAGLGLAPVFQGSTMVSPRPVPQARPPQPGSTPSAPRSVPVIPGPGPDAAHSGKAPAAPAPVAKPAPVPEAAAPVVPAPVAKPVPVPEAAAPVVPAPVAKPVPVPEAAAPAAPAPVAKPAPVPETAAPAAPAPVAKPVPVPEAAAPVAPALPLLPSLPAQTAAPQASETVQAPPVVLPPPPVVPPGFLAPGGPKPLPALAAKAPQPDAESAPPSAPKSGVRPLPSRLPVRKTAPEPELVSVGAPAPITRHSFIVQLGELPPAVASDVDDAEELIE